jgi:small-conductance mechanosensitive channel
MLAALGVGGLAVALALQQPLANLFAALAMTFAHQIRIGDYIRLEAGPEGRIVDQRWDATTLRTLGGNIVIIPNSSLAQAIVTNFDRPTPDVGCMVEFTVGTDADLIEVERLAVAAGQFVMKEVPGGVPDADVSVRFQAFSDTGIRCALNARSRQFEDQGLIRHELAKRVHATLRDAGIDIAILGAPRPKREGKTPA